MRQKMHALVVLFLAKHWRLLQKTQIPGLDRLYLTNGEKDEDRTTS